ncbi:MAG TPA: LuxR C-terminal-related transcriptional regulator [Clostridia bacterium]|jgi:DNA-binding CsgD family transcriptional regulator|nr:LuxR C-terminal-related transcriptional regulator [Clostridia bacterium]
MEQDKGRDHAADAVMTLTPREKQVFYMLLKGMKAKEIFLRMSISV